MKALSWLVIGVFLSFSLFIHLDGCVTHGTPGLADTIYKKDTLWKRYDTVIKKTLVVKDTIHDSIPVAYDPHPDYDSLKLQYNNLLKDFRARNVYEDSLKIDSFGYVLIQDTLQFNKLGIRSYSSHYKLPTIIDSVIITKQAPSKSDLYYGAGFAGSKVGLDFMHMGLLYKNKKNHISGVFVAVNPDFKLSYGIQTYWKISRKK